MVVWQFCRSAPIGRKMRKVGTINIFIVPENWPISVFIWKIKKLLRHFYYITKNMTALKQIVAYP